MKEETIQLKVGAIVWATGWHPYDAAKVQPYGYDRYKNVITRVEFERMPDPFGPTGGKLVWPSDGESFENPKYLDKLTELMGAEAVEKYDQKVTCCGGALVFSEPEKSQAQIKKIIESAYDFGAEMIVTPCPVCQMNVEVYQGRINKKYGTVVLLTVDGRGLRRQHQGSRARWQHRARHQAGRERRQEVIRIDRSRKKPAQAGFFLSDAPDAAPAGTRYTDLTCINVPPTICRDDATVTVHSEGQVMQGLLKYGFCRWVRSARVHVWIGVAVFTISCYFMITDTYENLMERQRAESLLNFIGLASLFYAAVAWYLNFFLQPHLPPACERK